MGGKSAMTLAAKSVSPNTGKRKYNKGIPKDKPLPEKEETKNARQARSKAQAIKLVTERGLINPEVPSSSSTQTAIHTTEVAGSEQLPIIVKRPKLEWKFMSWNVSGFNASVKKGLKDVILQHEPDVLCLQEIKLNAAPNDFMKGEYPYQYWLPCTVKKGYAGSAVLSARKPLNVEFEIPGFEGEGRTITLEFDDFYFIASYVPNSGMKLERLGHKVDFSKGMIDYIKALSKPVIWGGDLNVAHKEVDLARPKTNKKTPGFTDEERKEFSNWLEKLDLIDTYRELHPDVFDVYTYYSYRFSCHSKNIGWRLDYFLVSNSIMSRVVSSDIQSQDYGASDHVPITILFNMNTKSN